ncbi:holo-ACP synthase [Paractinoplanes lichenicola]|uniref:Holo-[acyl-carrier-protein] synthase n=1 Tax=Paractinoplanes lichenicola TaxID=2802976 RepID=A0ABS1VFC8_9ACTN|nr:holo-ACP synthase [Actinoplanes lichenicola]MBL7253405.1 holo-ACP synthase [Actinoplanes lichenicola]
MPPSPQPQREQGAGRSPDRPAPPPQVRTGIDVADVARVEELMTSVPGLQERVFTPRELAYCYRHRRAGEHLAGRWAAKEAVLKSFGTGMGPRMEWTDIEVVNDRNGRPRVHLYGEVEAVARSFGMHHIEISVSHSAGIAVAHAVMVCLPGASTRYPDLAEGDDRHEV